MISIFQLNRSGVHHKQSALRRISDSSTVSFVAPKIYSPISVQWADFITQTGAEAAEATEFRVRVENRSGWS